MDKEEKREYIRNKAGAGGFFLSLLLNLILSLGWSVPGIILLVVHFIWPTLLPLWPGLAALGLWFLVIFIQTLVLVLVINLGNRPSIHDVQNKENKNPYSQHGEYEKSLRDRLQK